MAEKEYIERETAREAVWQILNGMGYSEKHNDRLVEEVDAILDDIPAADVRPVVKAEWHGEADGYADGELVYDMWSCPICGKRFEEWEEKPDWNFCPNCGTDMMEE